MALQIADRVRELTTTSGTGTVNLAGATAGFQSFVAGIGTGNACHYLLLDGTAWETGVGTVTDGSPDTLTRDTVIASSNAGAKISLSGGETVVLCTLPGSASQIRAAIGITDNGIIDWTSTSSNFNTSGSVTSGALTANGNTTLGDASADTLTINAGTWTLGNKYTATRAAGVAAAGLTFFGTWSTSFSGDAGGTTNGRALLFTTDVQGSNSVAQGRALQQNLENQLTSGTLALGVCNTTTFNNTSASNTTDAVAYAAQLSIQSSGNITTGVNYSANTPSLTGAGAFTTLSGFRSANLGHATLVANAIGHQADDMTIAATLTASFRSQQNSGTGAWGFLHTGTANNAFAGNVRIGSTTAPTVALDVTGSATISGNTTLGDASGDSLTINAGTWTIGSNYEATRAAGTVAAGVVNVIKNTTTLTGDSGGTSNIRTFYNDATAQGANNISVLVGTRLDANHNGTGTITTARGVFGLVQNLSSGTITTARGSEYAVVVAGSGSVTLAETYYSSGVTFTGAGLVTTSYGFHAAGYAKSGITTGVGFIADDVSGSTTMRGFQSSLSSGSGKWNAFFDGTANNAFNGNVRIGSTTAPTVALDVTGAGLFSSTVSTLASGTGRTVLSNDAGGSLTLGRIDSVASTPYIDFNSGATTVDYDVRLQASGGTGAAGGGLLTMTGALDATGAIKTATTLRTGGYTVATLPAGVVGMRAYVTDALAPAFLGALVGGGAVTCPAFYNGAAWVAG